MYDYTYTITADNGAEITFTGDCVDNIDYVAINHYEMEGTCDTLEQIAIPYKGKMKYIIDFFGEVYEEFRKDDIVRAQERRHEESLR